MRVLVTGSRKWPSRSEVWAELDAVAADWGSSASADDRPSKLTVVHGACWIGADRMAAEWCRRHPDVVEERRPADWGAGKGAGFVRNAEMVAAGADLCLAFVYNKSPGASHCAGLARAAGIPVRLLERTGLAATVRRAG
jgi:hypothetical protein